LACLLSEAYKEMLASGTMSLDMRTGLVTLIHKGKGPKDDLDNYRPITVLCAVYKILSRAMALKLGAAVHHLVDNGQAAFQSHKRTTDVTRLVQDKIDHCDDQESEGLLVFCDQAKAYDRVNWDFLFRTLDTLGLPADFTRLTRLLLHDNQISVKVNGHLGSMGRVSDGVKQGCSLSPLLYILVFQTLACMCGKGCASSHPHVRARELRRGEAERR
jgi:hypothetical protein